MKRFLLLPVLLMFVAFTNAQHVNPVVLISGKVVNERNMKPVGCKVRYEILPEGKEAGIARSNPANGEYKIILPSGKKYGYMAVAEGYYSVTKYLDLSELKEYEEQEENNLYMAPVEKDQVVRINNVFFEEGTAILTQASFAELNRLVLFLKVNKKIYIEIAGHTDNAGDSDKSMDLSEQRAQAVANYLISKKIKEKRLTVKGYGDTRPIGFNSSEEGRARNNRIEFTVLSLTKPN